MTEKNKGGRPPVEVDEAKRRLIQCLLSHGESPARVAQLAGMAESTLRKHCKEEVESAHGELYARIALNLTQKALGDGREAVTAAIFWLKTRAGWREKGEAQQEQQPIVMFSAPLVDGEGIEQWLEKRRTERETN